MSALRCIMIFDKKAERKLARQMLSDFPEEYINSSNAKIAEAVTALPEYIAANRVFAYYSVGREVDTHEVIIDALNRGKTVALPVVYGDGIMEYAVITSLSGNLVGGQLSIPEPDVNAPRITPAEGDFLLVPALRFDEDGFRLGQGGGYYDRLLSGCKAFSAGLCREQMLMPAVPREAHDMGVACLITEKKAARLQ